MRVELQCIVLDCDDARTLARFYQALLGGEVDKPDRRWVVDDSWSTLHIESGQVLGFQRTKDYRPPRWPDPDQPQQFHLDLGVDDLDATQQRVLELGARLLDEGEAGRCWRVFADPAGHPFCLVLD